MPSKLDFPRVLYLTVNFGMLTKNHQLFCFRWTPDTGQTTERRKEANPGLATGDFKGPVKRARVVKAVSQIAYGHDNPLSRVERTRDKLLLLLLFLLLLFLLLLVKKK